MMGDEQVMSVITGVPTTSVYSQIDQILNVSIVRGIISLSAVSAAIVILVWILVRWNNSLQQAVRHHTVELKKSNEELTQANTMLSEYNKQLGSAFDQVIKANEKLAAQDRMQREFINIAAHELRTPVQPLLGVADMLEDNMEDADRIEISRPEIEMIIRNASRLERLSSDILEVSRIESRSLVLHKEQIDLNKKVAQIVEDIETSIHLDKPVRLVFEPCMEPLYVHADRSRLFEVLSNLLNNAVKFTESGTITIKADKKDDNAIICVKDAGTGIDPEIMPRLFTKFASRSDTGTGLGLFISKSIVEAHGGRIWAENNSEGAGATFTFALPVVIAQGGVNTANSE
jgi:signal transduction histidine kinase